jgi:hypothetical protein
VDAREQHRSYLQLLQRLTPSARLALALQLTEQEKLLVELRLQCRAPKLSPDDVRRWAGVMRAVAHPT